MEINFLNLQNFRKFRESKFNFKKGINIITGPNGSGKTSVLEAISMLFYPRNIKSAGNEEIIKKGETFSIVHSLGTSRNGRFNLKLKIYLNEKELFLFDKKVPSYTYIFQRFPVIFFYSKKDHIFWDKSELLREINYIFSVIDTEYFKILLSYNRILKQRNKFLKNTHNKTDPFKKILQDNGKILQRKRIIYIKEIEEIMKRYINIKIHYSPSQLDAEPEKERERGRTLFGISRDKIHFEKDGYDLKTQCSEGEKRLFLFYFYIAFAEMMKKRGKYPLILFDDPFSILDYTLVKDFLKKWDGQIIITSLRSINLNPANVIEL